MLIKKLVSIRKGCIRCGSKLISFKEKVTRNCESCSRVALDGFDKMAGGEVKTGFKQVIYGKTDEEKEVVKATVGKVLNRKRKKLIQSLRKRGLSEEEITAGLEKFDKI